MQELYTYLDTILRPGTDVVFSTDECMMLCSKYRLTTKEFVTAIKAYCILKDVNYQTYNENNQQRTA